MIPKTSSQLATLVGGALDGAGDIAFTGLSSLADATEHEATFITSDAHAKLWDHSRARIAIVGNQVKTELSNSPKNHGISPTSAQGAQGHSRA